MQLQIESMDGRIRNWGQPPWADQDNYPDTQVIDIGDQEAPDDDLRDYRYVEVEGVFEFVFDPLPPTQEELDTAADREAVNPTNAAQLLDAIQTRRQQIAARQTQIGNRRTQIASDLTGIPTRRTQIASDLTVAANASAATLKQLRDRQLNAEDALLQAVQRMLNGEDSALNAEDGALTVIDWMLGAFITVFKALRRLV